MLSSQGNYYLGKLSNALVDIITSVVFESKWLKKWKV